MPNIAVAPSSLPPPPPPERRIVFHSEPIVGEPLNYSVRIEREMPAALQGQMESPEFQAMCDKIENEILGPLQRWQSRVSCALNCLFSTVPFVFILVGALGGTKADLYTTAWALVPLTITAIGLNMALNKSWNAAAKRRLVLYCEELSLPGSGASSHVGFKVCNPNLSWKELYIEVTLPKELNSDTFLQEEEVTATTNEGCPANDPAVQAATVSEADTTDCKNDTITENDQHEVNSARETFEIGSVEHEVV